MYLVLLIFHFIGLALGVGASFASVALASAGKELEANERVKFALRTAVLRKNGSIGLGLLILTGLGMFILRGPAEVFRWGGPAFHAKLTLVVIMIGVFGYMQVVGKKVREAGGGPLLARLPKLALAMLLLAVATIVCAVLAFK